MEILVIDGQGGGLGRQLVAAVKKAVPQAVVTAIGTNSAATSAMLKAGADRAATGENAVVVGCRRADVILGPIGIVMADAMLGEITPAMAQRIETEIRYAGYIAREERIIRDIQRHENVKIPDDFDYAPIETMTLESREKLAKIRPRTLAQAGRIPGVSPSDLAQLSIVILKDSK